MPDKNRVIELVLNVFLLICCLIFVVISIISKDVLNIIMWLITGVSFYIPFVVEPNISQSSDSTKQKTNSQQQPQNTIEPITKSKEN